jgi:hypothetical protein
VKEKTPTAYFLHYLFNRAEIGGERVSPQKLGIGTITWLIKFNIFREKLDFFRNFRNDENMLYGSLVYESNL